MDNHVEEYRNLLTGSESLESLDRALVLVGRALGVRFEYAGTEIRLHKVEQRFGKHEPHWWTLPRIVHMDEKEYVQHVFADIHEAGERRLRTKAQTLRRKQIKLVHWCLAHLANDINKISDMPRSQYSFIMDTLLLVFHHAHFALLPELDAPIWRDARKGLIESFLAFSDQVPEQAEAFRIRGLVHNARGDIAKAIESFSGSLALTQPDEHVFMTRLQTAWMSLLEGHHYRDALQLLLDTYPRVLRKDIQEVAELIQQTFGDLEKHLKKAS